MISKPVAQQRFFYVCSPSTQIRRERTKHPRIPKGQNVLCSGLISVAGGDVEILKSWSESGSSSSLLLTEQIPSCPSGFYYLLHFSQRFQ